MTRTPPPHVPRAIIGAALDFPWQGERAHAGPMETMTPLLERLSGTTTCGQLAMCAGVLEWVAWRLQGHVAIDNALHYCDAAFAYQVDQRYTDAEAIDWPDPPMPPALEALTEVTGYLWTALGDDFSSSYYQPIRETFHAANVARHITPAAHRKDFDAWLEGLSDRVHALAPKPAEPFKKKKDFESPAAYRAFVARHFGAPLPREILVPDAALDQPEALARQFVTTLDWRANPYLRAPEAMQELGFEGEPYT